MKNYKCRNKKVIEIKRPMGVLVDKSFPKLVVA